MADSDSRAGARYATPEALAWVDGVHAPHDAGLDRARRAPDEEGMPAIHLGASEGRALWLLLRMTGAARVVEVGTLAGYSAIWIARALPEHGRLWTLEKDPRHAEIARESLRQAGVADRVEVLVGDAADLLPSLVTHGPFDAVFVDADKGRYDRYGRWAAKNLRSGGLLVGDNAYYFGKLLDESDEASAMRRFHREAARNFDTACLPTPDGMLVGIRRSES